MDEVLFAVSVAAAQQLINAVFFFLNLHCIKGE
jgi:hypothetical protein